MCVHVADAARAEMESLKEQQQAIKAEMDKIGSCNTVIGCAVDKLIDAQNNLSNGFISGGVPFCEGGIFAEVGGLSTQVSDLEKISEELTARIDELDAMNEALLLDIDRQQNIINNPGDCAACIAAKAWEEKMSFMETRLTK